MKQAGKWERKSLEGDFPRVLPKSLNGGMESERGKESHL